MANFTEQSEPEQRSQIKTSASKKKKRKILSYVLLGILILVIAWVLQGIYLPMLNNQYGTDGLVTIEKGDGLMDIAEKLRAVGVIKSKYLFAFYVSLADKQSVLKAGAYYFPVEESMNIPRVMTILAEGRIAKKKLIIIEGWSLRDIAWWFENQALLQAEELFKLVGFPAVDNSQAQDLPALKDFSVDFEFLQDKPKEVSLEGYLFPDTYEIVPFDESETIEAIVHRILSNFENKVLSQSDLMEQIEQSGRSLFEILTMASLLEKEVKTFEDKQMVAGILWKRLADDWKLQVDATLTYLLGKPSQEISKGDLEIDSPYNTYKYYGLPLGPIANPGIESIKAAVNFEDSPYWFYLTTPEGETLFSETLEQHNINKAEHLK